MTTEPPAVGQNNSSLDRLALAARELKWLEQEDQGSENKRPESLGKPSDDVDWNDFGK
jgi:hypothetical protein